MRMKALNVLEAKREEYEFEFVSALAAPPFDWSFHMLEDCSTYAR